MTPPIIPIDDIAEPGAECECEFTPDPSDPDESWHFLRRCVKCKAKTYSLHCPHDGIQGKCRQCGQRLPQIREEP